VKFRQGDPWEWVYLWLACVLPSGLSRMPGSRPGFTPHFGWGSMAALDSGTLAYLTVREGDDADGRLWEIGVTGHGPPRHVPGAGCRRRHPRMGLHCRPLSG